MFFVSYNLISARMISLYEINCCNCQLKNLSCLYYLTSDLIGSNIVFKHFFLQTETEHSSYAGSLQTQEINLKEI